MRPSIFFFNAAAPTDIYPLSLHDALPICLSRAEPAIAFGAPAIDERALLAPRTGPELRPAGSEQGPLVDCGRSEEHTSELQSPYDLVCRLLLEKKKK